MPGDDPQTSLLAGLEGRRLFISYASEDRHRAVELQDALGGAGAATIWLDRDAILAGDDWREEIKAGLRDCEAVLALLSVHSRDEGREWIVFEHSEALRLLRPVIPLRLDDEDPPERLSGLQYADFRSDWVGALQELTECLEKHLPRSGTRLADERSDLPPTHGFVGRERDIAAVAGLLRLSGPKVSLTRPPAVIQGMGGLGKSALASEVVRRLAPRYPGGVLYVTFGRQAEDADTVLGRWVELADGRHPDSAVTPAMARERLQRFGELLVFIDDVGESDLDEVRVLLEALPQDASVVLTTRSTKVANRLGTATHEHRLSRLSEADALDLLRATLARLETLPDESLLLELVTRLDGHPQSLALLAGRCDQSSDLPLLLEELDYVLETGDLGLEDLDIDSEDQDKYTSVAASMALSYAGLERLDAAGGKDHARKFRMLGLLPGNGLIDESMLLSLWGVDPKDRIRVIGAHRSMDTLARRAMLLVDDETEKYLLHPLMCAFALGRLREHPDDFDKARHRYLDHVVRRAGDLYALPPEEWPSFKYYERHVQYVGAALVRDVTSHIEGDIDDLGAPHGLEDEERWHPAGLTDEARRDYRHGQGFARAVRRFVQLRPELGRDGADWLKVGLVASRALDDDLSLVRFVRYVGQWHLRRDAPLALEYFDEAVRRARANQTTGEFVRELGNALSYRGEALRVLGRPEEAINGLQRALVLHRKGGDAFMQAQTLKSLGETFWRKGDHKAALARQESALALFRSRPGLRGQQADILNKIGSVHFNSGDQETALQYFQQALDIHREVGNRFMECEDLNDMGIANKYLGNLDAARTHLSAALHLAKEVGYVRLEAIAQTNLASLYNEEEDFGRSLANAEIARDRARFAQDRLTESWALNWIALALARAGQGDEAREMFEEGFELARGRSVRTELALRGNLGELELRSFSRPAEAAKILEDVVATMEAKELEQVYGGRRLEDYRDLLREAQTKLSSRPQRDPS